jgi:hypothetical protein
VWKEGATRNDQSCSEHYRYCSEVEEMRYVYYFGGKRGAYYGWNMNKFLFSGPIITRN